jgi:glycosyltransferase involved in cell wall biosynthesis
MLEKLKCNKTINLVNVARFNPQKNHLFLLDIFSELLNYGNYNLFLVGEGDLKNVLLDKIKILNLESNVFFLGVRNDVHDILQAMDIFLFPSLFEGLPVSLIEAQASGIKCVISDGVPEESILINENVDIISLKENAKQWAEKISKINFSDRKDVSEIIVNKGYDIINNAKKLEQKYFSLIEENK